MLVSCLQFTIAYRQNSGLSEPVFLSVTKYLLLTQPVCASVTNSCTVDQPKPKCLVILDPETNLEGLKTSTVIVKPLKREFYKNFVYTLVFPIA